MPLTQSRLVLRYMCVRTDGLVLPVDEDPQPDLGLGVVEVLRDALLEHAICLVLQDAEGGQIRCGPVPLVESGKIEAFVLREGIIGDDLNLASGTLLMAGEDGTHLGCQVQVLFLAFPLLRLHLKTLLLEATLCGDIQ